MSLSEIVKSGSALRTAATTPTRFRGPARVTRTSPLQRQAHELDSRYLAMLYSRMVEIRTIELTSIFRTPHCPSRAGMSSHCGLHPASMLRITSPTVSANPAFSVRLHALTKACPVNPRRLLHCLLPQPARLVDFGSQFFDPRHDPPLLRKRGKRNLHIRAHHSVGMAASLVDPCAVT